MLNVSKISLIAAGVNLVIAILGGYLTRIFTNNAEIISMVRIILFLQVLLDPMRVSNEILVSNLNLVKEVKYPVIVGVITTYALVIPLAYISVKKLGLDLNAVLRVFIIDESLRRILFTKRFKEGKWIKLNEENNGDEI